MLGEYFPGYQFRFGQWYFSSASLPALPAGMYWKLNYNPTDVTLEITNINPCIPPVTPATVSGLVNVCAYVGTNTPLTYSVNPDPNATGYLWVLPPSVTLVSGQGTSTIIVTIGAGFINSANKLIRVKPYRLRQQCRQIVLPKSATPPTPVSITASSNNICPFWEIISRLHIAFPGFPVLHRISGRHRVVIRSSPIPMGRVKMIPW